MANGIVKKFLDDGDVLIRPGESHRWGKMTLSLWQQGTCTSVTILGNDMVRTRTLYMRPIFSGSTVNADRHHDIQYWLDTKGASAVDTKANNKTAPAIDAKADNNTATLPDQSTSRQLEDSTPHVRYYHYDAQNEPEIQAEVGDVVYFVP